MGFFQQVWFHKLGTPTEQDTYELGKELPRIAEIGLESSDDGTYVLASVKNGDGGEAEFFLRGPGGWTQISRFEDQLQQGVMGRDGAAYFLSRDKAPNGKVLRIPLQVPSLANATVVVPEGDGAIGGFVPADTRLYVEEILGGPTRVRAFPLRGGAPETIPVPEVASVNEIARLHGGDVLINVVTYLSPPAFFRVDAGTPLNGKNPTLLYGYGGYGVSNRPYFSPSLRVWIEAGGIVVDASLRGGGEYGEAWHKAGNLTRKQNVFDDFYAVAQHLVAKRYTDKEHLVILGGSNGGLLMGAELTQHPQAWKAVVASVGIFDMLRVENTPNGAFNVTEFGTVKDPQQFKALYAYSPYHHVKKGQRYPATLLLTGANDPRVEPWHSRKMVARLQAANASRAPVLLRTSSSTGHGIGSALDEIIAQRTDIYGFYFAVLGIHCCLEVSTR